MGLCMIERSSEARFARIIRCENSEYGNAWLTTALDRPRDTKGDSLQMTSHLLPLSLSLSLSTATSITVINAAKFKFPIE